MWICQANGTCLIEFRIFPFFFVFIVIHFRHSFAIVLRVYTFNAHYICYKYIQTTNHTRLILFLIKYTKNKFGYNCLMLLFFFPATSCVLCIQIFTRNFHDLFLVAMNSYGFSLTNIRNYRINSIKNNSKPSKSIHVHKMNDWELMRKPFISWPYGLFTGLELIILTIWMNFCHQIVKKNVHCRCRFSVLHFKWFVGYFLSTVGT